RSSLRAETCERLNRSVGRSRTTALGRMETNRFSGPGMGHGSSASHLEACRFKHSDQFVDVAPEEAFEESRVHALIAALNRFDNKQPIRFQDFQDLPRNAIDVK